MNASLFAVSRFLLAIVSSALVIAPAWAAPAEATRTALRLERVTAAKALENGVEFHSGPAVMQITALRDDVIRVRVGPAGTLPEDASWAVLPEARDGKGNGYGGE